MRRFMDTRSSLRQVMMWVASEVNFINFVVKCISDVNGPFTFGYQGALAQRRSNFQGNQFPLAAEFARKAAVAPLRNRAFGYNRMPNWKARY